jgi:sRNA-binding protein
MTHIVTMESTENTKPEKSNESPDAAVKLVRENLCSLYPILKQNKPLKIGIDKEIAKRHPEVPRDVITKIIGLIAVQDGYLESMIVGAPRYDLDGNPTAQVINAEQAEGANVRLTRVSNPLNRLRIKKKGVSKKQVPVAKTDAYGQVPGKLLKVAVPIDLAPVLELNSIGKSAVWLKVTLPCGTEVAVRINAKSFRKAVETYKSVNGNVAVVISGELHPADSEIKSAGIVANVKQPKGE